MKEVKAMGKYMFHGCDVEELAIEYGTPLYVVSEDEIVNRIERLKRCFDRRYERCGTYFASKSFLTKDMLRILMKEGIGLDVVSGGELFLAKDMRFPPEKIAFHGNSKTIAEIADGLSYGVGKFVCDSMEEIELIDRMAKERKTKANILVRVTPGVDSHTHKYISTAGVDSKFGIPLMQMEEAVSLCMRLENISLKGFHFHVGSQLLENTSHLMAVDIMLDLIERVRTNLGFETDTLDLGGGFGIAYTSKDRPQEVEDFIGPMVEKIEAFCAAEGMRRPSLVIEPGRWIVGEAGITLYTVGSVKEIPGVNTYIGVDGGFPDNPRPALYQAEYSALIAGKCDRPPAGTVTIAGKCCESGDILIRDIALPEAERGDILVMFATGAYNHSMANNYNKNPIPAVVMIRDGKPRLSVRRQTYEEMFAGNC